MKKQILGPPCTSLLAFAILAIFARSTELVQNPVPLSPAERAQACAREEAEREQSQSVAEIFDMMALAEGHQVADVGAGSGFFTVRLARAVSRTGRVFAVDISEKVVSELEERIKEQRLQNVTVIHGEEDNPKLPIETLDATLIVDSYHEMPKHESILRHILAALKPGGRLMIIEPFNPARLHDPREKQEGDHLIAPDFVERDLREAGFEIVARNDQFVEHKDSKTRQAFVLARRPRKN